MRQARQPANVIAPIIFPLGLLAVNSGGLQPATAIPGFPTDRFVAFALAIPFMQGALFATMNAGTDLARDIQTGFLNRLSLTPVRGVALVVGQLAGVAFVAAIQAVVYVLVAYAVHVHPAAGAAGVVVLLGLAIAIAIGFGAAGVFMALRTGSGESVQGLFPVLFVFLLVSSMNFPRNLIEAGWFRWLATVNPVSYLIEGLRSLIIEGWNGEALGARVRVLRPPDRALPGRVRVRAPHEDDANVRAVRDFRNVAFAVGWRTIHNVLHNPSLLIPGMVFPLLNFVAFAGGLSQAPAHLRASTIRPAMPASSSASCCSSRPRSAASSRASGSRATSSTASPAA